MKKVSVFFASAACLVAAVGVYGKVAKAAAVDGTVYFVPVFANRAADGPFCTQIVTPTNCAGNGLRCTILADYGPNGTAIAKVSKIVTVGGVAGNCVIAKKP
jgi:hypothetical protein